MSATASRPRTLLVTATVVALLGSPACARAHSSKEQGSQDYAIAVELHAPPLSGTTGTGCQLAPHGVPDDQFTPDATLRLHIDSGLSVGQAQIPAGVLDTPGDCRVTLVFSFVPGDAPLYVLRTNRGDGWRLTRAEAFPGPAVIDLVARPPVST